MALYFCISTMKIQQSTFALKKPHEPLVAVMPDSRMGAGSFVIMPEILWVIQAFSAVS